MVTIAEHIRGRGIDRCCTRTSGRIGRRAGMQNQRVKCYRVRIGCGRMAAAIAARGHGTRDPVTPVARRKRSIRAGQGIIMLAFDKVPAARVGTGPRPRERASPDAMMRELERLRNELYPPVEARVSGMLVL